MVYSNTRARCSQATRPHEEMAIYNISATTRGRSSPLPRSRDSATSRERPAGSGLVAIVMAHALLGVVRAVSSGDMLVILVLSSIHHTKSEMCGAFRALAERPGAHTTTLCRCASYWPSIVNVRLLLHPHLVTTLLPTARLIWVQVQSTPIYSRESLFVVRGLG